MEEKIPINLDILDEGIKNIENLQSWGHYFAEKEDGGKNKITTTQLRRFFGALKQIQVDFDNKKGEILLLDAKLAYSVGRDVKRGQYESKLKEFYDLVSPLIRAINENKTKFKNFVSVIEALVAYHREKEELK